MSILSILSDLARGNYPRVSRPSPFRLSCSRQVSFLDPRRALRVPSALLPNACSGAPKRRFDPCSKPTLADCAVGRGRPAVWLRAGLPLRTRAQAHLRTPNSFTLSCALLRCCKSATRRGFHATPPTSTTSTTVYLPRTRASSAPTSQRPSSSHGAMAGVQRSCQRRRPAAVQ